MFPIPILKGNKVRSPIHEYVLPTFFKRDLFRFSHPEIPLQGIPLVQRIRHPLPDELRTIRQEHGVRSVLPAASRLSGDPRDSVERRQFWFGEEGVSVVPTAPAGPVARTPNRCDAEHTGEVQMASVLCRHQSHRRP